VFYQSVTNADPAVALPRHADPVLARSLRAFSAVALTRKR
jgi:hypothetical protein